MPLVGTHQVRPFTSPVNTAAAMDANMVRGNDNVLRNAYVAHDADPTIHLQSSNSNDRPAAGVVGRFWVTIDNGSYRFWYDDGMRWHEIGNEKIDVEVIGLEAGGIVPGDVLKIVGWNNGLNLPEVQKVSSSTDIAFAIAEESIANNGRGYAVNTGVVDNLDTSAFSVGDILYPNTSGGLTTSKPTFGLYQVCAYVLRAAVNGGTLFVEFSGPRIVERSDNTASTVVLRDASGNFTAGTVSVTIADAATEYRVAGTKVVGAQGATISDPTGGTVQDSEARTAINAIIDRLQAHGLIA